MRPAQETADAGFETWQTRDFEGLSRSLRDNATAVHAPGSAVAAPRVVCANCRVRLATAAGLGGMPSSGERQDTRASPRWSNSVYD